MVFGLNRPRFELLLVINGYMTLSKCFHLERKKSKYLLNSKLLDNLGKLLCKVPVIQTNGGCTSLCARCWKSM